MGEFETWTGDKDAILEGQRLHRILHAMHAKRL
jgi:hypothetical protein